MKPFSVHPVVKEGFSIAARHEGTAVFLKISGNGDMETPITLSGYLKKVHGEALRLQAATVIVECDELYFMSSACVKCLVMWIDGIVKLDPAARYKVRFKANANLPWQRRSFEALRRFAPALVHIESDSTQIPNAAQAPHPQSGNVPQSPAVPQSAPMPQAGTVPQTPTARRKP